MTRALRLTAALLATLSLHGGTARAQYVYPPGYGGWGGWGWGGGETATGATARGMGAFARGVGAYNLQTAQARAINADTTARFNQYMWEAQQVRNRQQAQRMAARRQQVNLRAETVFQRLRDEPTQADIFRGDALNVALDQVTAPGVYFSALPEAQVSIPSTMIRHIPFNQASEGITLSLDELTDAQHWPEVLKNPTFQTELQNLAQVADRARQEDDEGDLTSATLQQLESAIMALRQKFEAKYPDRNSRERTQASPYLKGLTGLVRMLSTPEIQTLLRQVDNEPTRSLADLLGFMTTFNLRFGVAGTPEARAAYQEIFTKLDALRDAIGSQTELATPFDVKPSPERHQAPQEFFHGMEPEHLTSEGPIPPVPEARP